MEEMFPILLFAGAALLGIAIIAVMSSRAQNRGEGRAKSMTRRAELLRSIPEAPAPGVLTTLRVAVALSLFWSLGTVVYSISVALFSARAGASLSGPVSALFFTAIPLLVSGIAVFPLVVAVAFFQKRRWVPGLLSASLALVLAGPFLVEDTNRSPVVLVAVVAAAFSLSIVLQRSRSLWHHCGWSAQDADRLDHLGHENK